MYDNAWTGTPRDKDSPDAHYNLQSAGFEVCSVCNDIFRVQGASGNVRVHSKAYRIAKYKSELEKSKGMLVYFDKKILELKDSPHLAIEFMKRRDTWMAIQKNNTKKLAKLTRDDTDRSRTLVVGAQSSFV
jgi:hypothetical protein